LLIVDVFCSETQKVGVSQENFILFFFEKFLKSPKFSSGKFLGRYTFINPNAEKENIGFFIVD